MNLGKPYTAKTMLLPHPPSGCAPSARAVYPLDGPGLQLAPVSEGDA
jgi:hypothetical protein